MQIIFLPQGLTILLCFIVWPILQVSAALLCTRLPDRCFDYAAWFYRAHRWENDGELYEQWLRVRRWKKYLPDGGSLVKGGFEKKKLVSFSKDNLDKYLLESCRAEMIHWLAILPFWVFGFFTPPGSVAKGGSSKAVSPTSGRELSYHAESLPESVGYPD